jgi:hypothetical protein
MEFFCDEAQRAIKSFWETFESLLGLGPGKTRLIKPANRI